VRSGSLIACITSPFEGSSDSLADFLGEQLVGRSLPVIIIACREVESCGQEGVGVDQLDSLFFLITWLESVFSRMTTSFLSPRLVTSSSGPGRAAVCGVVRR